MAERKSNTRTSNIGRWISRMSTSFTVTVLTVAVVATFQLINCQGYAHDTKRDTDYMVKVTQAPPTDFHDPNVVGDQAHLREHLSEEIGDMKRDMTPEEMEFHYFRLHDTNNDTLLDGLEIMNALTHMVPPNMYAMPQELRGKTPEEAEQLRKERSKQILQGIVAMIDKVLVTDDVDKDGYLTYPEYIVARRRDRRNMMKMQQEMLKQAEAMKNQHTSINDMTAASLNMQL